MDVHVPEAGEKKFSGGVDGARGLGNFYLCSGSDGGYAVAFDKNGLVELRRVAGGIDESDVRDGELWWRFCQGMVRNQKESGKRGEKYLSNLQRYATFRATGQF